MNLTNLLDYSNSVYDFNKKINTIERKNLNAHTKPSTALKMFTFGIFTNAKSINQIENGIFNSTTNRLKNIFKKKEFIPKTHAFRECINDIDYKDVREIHYHIIDKLKENKFFENHDYRGSRVLIGDGIEAFETNKKIDGLHLRNHKDGSEGYYFKMLGLMYLTEDVDIMIDMVPFESYEVKDDKEKNAKVKAEGEITVFKRILPTLKDYKIDIAVLDCMFLNGPCFTTAKNNGIDVIVKLTDERRDLYKDASQLFKTQKSKMEYEVVEVSETKKIRYSKSSKKKNTSETKKYIITREITDNEINKSVVVEDKEVVHPKKTVYLKTTHKVIRRAKVYADDFEMNNYGKVKVIKVEEESSKGIKEMYIVTTLLNEDLEFIVDLMHKRWDIELKGFRKLKSRYNLDHLYIGTDNAIRLTVYLTLIIYNLMELYFNVHTRKYKYKINFDNLLEDYKIEVAITPNMYQYFLV